MSDVQPCCFEQAIIVKGGMLAAYSGRDEGAVKTELKSLETLQGKHFMELHAKDYFLSKFLTGTPREFHEEVNAMLEDLKVARRKSTLYCVLNETSTSAAPQPGQADASSPLRKTHSNRWLWTDRLQTKRIRDASSIDALPPVIQVKLPPLNGSAEPHIMSMLPGHDMLHSVKMEFTQQNMQWLLESTIRHRNKLGKEVVIWCLQKCWVASKLKDIDVKQFNTCVL